MLKYFCVALALIGFAIAPATAAKKAPAKRTPKKVAKRVAAPTKSAKTTAKADTKVTAPRKGSTPDGLLEPDVTFKANPTAKVAPPDKVKPEDPKVEEPKTASTEEPTGPPMTAKEQEATEKQAQAKLSKDPKGALEDYRRLISANPNYRYAGDVWMNMYQAATRTNADLLDQIKYAGKAAQAIGMGQSRRGADKKLAAKYDNISNQLIYKWIDIETKKIMAGQYQ